MTFIALEKKKKNSVPAVLTAPASSTDDSFSIDHLEYFHDADGVFITRGIVLGYDDADKTKPEEVTITTPSTTSGPGTLSGVVRGVNADGSIGAANAWPAGTKIAVMGVTSGDWNQIKDNFVEHATLITARATKTTAAMSVYVDSAATGAADGTSWTNAFTTIQAAIASLPVVLEHAVTIYVRKGASAYAENITVQQMVGKGSLTIRGEYYWNGECAAAATPSTTKFNLTAPDGTQIAAGDSVLIRDGYADYVLSTVKATVDKGSNVWEIELNNALPTGNIGTGDYYSIVKTTISPASGQVITVTSTSVTLRGLNVTGGSSYLLYASKGCDIDLDTCVLNSNISYGIYMLNSRLAYYRCYISAHYSIVTINTYVKSHPGPNGNIIYGSAIINPSATAGTNIWLFFNSSANIQHQILKHTNGTAVKGESLSYISLRTSTILTGTTTGIHVIENSVVTRTTVTNNATTPLNPASSTDNPVII